jgi:peroxiredoxin
MGGCRTATEDESDRYSRLSDEGILEKFLQGEQSAETTVSEIEQIARQLTQ